MNNKPSKKGLHASVAGTVLILLCCFTPILVITVGVVGLGTLTPYLDYILFSALGVMIVVTILAYRKYKKGCSECRKDDLSNNQE
ncbi:MAG: mercury resistance system transport protein MerF [Candidatus Paceibacterota bacterium]